jgi:glycosyltransferase involved in cell wall biosynthesis
MREHLLAKVTVFNNQISPDVVYRIFTPLQLRPDRTANRTFVFTTAEWAYLMPELCSGDVPIKDAFLDKRLTILTPSHWSKQGLVRSGMPDNRIEVIPHGADVRIFRPLNENARAECRRRRGWQGRFVFLNIGAMTDNKGIDRLLKAFSCVVAKYPEALLFLKGNDGLYNSREMFQKRVDGLASDLPNKVMQNIHYAGDDMKFNELASLYQAADAYVSPYLGEGFNLPVLEAMACGLPVICTQGGSTDDFINDASALPVASTLKQFPDTPYLYLDPDMESLIAQMERILLDSEFRTSARIHGPAHVRARYSWPVVVDRLINVLCNMNV